jgi:hypothetical protein
LTPITPIILVAVARAGVAAAGLGRDLGVGRQREPQAEAALGHGQQRLGHRQPRVERHRRDDPLAVVELEQYFCAGSP